MSILSKNMIVIDSGHQVEGFIPITFLDVARHLTPMKNRVRTKSTTT